MNISEPFFNLLHVYFTVNKHCKHQKQKEYDQSHFLLSYAP